MVKRRAPRPPVADEATAAATREGGRLEPLVSVARGFASLPSVETKDFKKAADGNPRLREELRRLLATYPPSELVALANALAASVKAARRAGPRAIPVPEDAEAAAKLWGARVKAAREQSGRRSHTACVVKERAIAEVAPLLLLPHGADDEARRERASDLIDLYADAPQPATRRRRAARTG